MIVATFVAALTAKICNAEPLSVPTASAPSHDPHALPCRNVAPLVASVGMPEDQAASCTFGMLSSVIGTDSL